MSKRHILSVLAAAMMAAATAAADDFVPFPIPGKPDPDSLIALRAAEPITTNSPRLITDGDSFAYKGKPVRLWGVNLSFNASLPTHEDAPNVAERLAQAGVNAVRIHHLDTSRWPRGIWDSATGKNIEPQALDRLDYFINELAKRGIWANFNLHVGRAHSDYLNLPKPNTSYDKIVGIFTPELIEAQKDYARKILTHVNKYRGVAYGDDPAVAIFEITNEDSFFMWSGDQDLRQLPEFYANILQSRFNTWLRDKYGSDQNLKTAWSKGIQPLGANVLKNSDFADIRADRTPAAWTLEQHEDCRASLSLVTEAGRTALKLAPQTVDETEWHLQFHQGDLSLTRDRYYTVTFEAAAVDKPRRISLGVTQNHDPWSWLGLSRNIELTTESQTFTFGFSATGSDTNARLSFSFGKDAGAIMLADVKLRPGGMMGLQDSESLKAGSVALFGNNESPNRATDRMVFLAETEKAYFDSMRNFIKSDLASKALVTGTIVFGPLGLYGQSDMDFIDSHAYWQHPRFPNRPWDPGDWLISQKPMTDFPEEATLFRLAAERLQGKPYTVSEYNHPAPNPYQAETIPMIASFAAAHNWSGIWFYTYSHSEDDWYRRNLNSFFDIDTNPAKWGFMRAGAAIFLNEKGFPPATPHEPGFGKLERAAAWNVASLARLHIKHDRDMVAVLADIRKSSQTPAKRYMTTVDEGDVKGIIIGSDRRNRLDPPDVYSPTNIVWTVKSGKGLYLASSRSARAYTGHAGRFNEATDGQVSVSSPEFVAMTMTPLNETTAHSLEQSGRILLTACGRCENTGMKFSRDRTTVGRNWGTAPVRIEAVDARVKLPPGKWTCMALTPGGTASAEVPVEDGYVHLQPKYKTMWYLVTADR